MKSSSESRVSQLPFQDCLGCKHFRGAKVGRCDAFPDQIPSEIWDGKVRHDKPFPGDRNIQFQPRLPDEFLTVEEFADLLNVDPKTIYRALWSKNLPAYKIGRVWRISKNEVEYFRK